MHTIQQRAALAERAICDRYLRRLWWLPGTRLGISRTPSVRRTRWFRQWDYWWQAHLLDCLVDAQLRDPSPRRRALARKLIRGAWLRNGMGRTNDYYDDMAWWGLALQRANEVFGFGTDITAILRACREAIGDEGVVPWRRGDPYFNTPANAPVAIMLARSGHTEEAARIIDWLRENLVMSDGLLADGRRGGPEDGELVPNRYTYTQGVGMAAELVAGGQPSTERIAELVDAVATHLAVEDVITGAGAGDGGLFAGILARYLALIAVELDGDERATRTRRRARDLVMASADAAWRGATVVDGGLRFGTDWSAPADEVSDDLSVQLSGWMVLESAAMLSRHPEVTP